MKCILREWRLEDAEKLSFMMNNPRIQENLRDGIPYPYRLRDAEEFILTTLLNNREFSLAITIKEEVVGSIGVFRRENIHFRTAEIGYYIAESHWGKGNRNKCFETNLSKSFRNNRYCTNFCRTFFR